MARDAYLRRTARSTMTMENCPRQKAKSGTPTRMYVPVKRARDVPNWQSG